MFGSLVFGPPIFIIMLMDVCSVMGSGTIFWYYFKMVVHTCLGKLFFDFGSTHLWSVGQPMFGLFILVGGIGWGPSRHRFDVLVQWEWQLHASSSKAGSRFTSAT